MNSWLALEVLLPLARTRAAKGRLIQIGAQLAATGRRILVHRARFALELPTGNHLSLPTKVRDVRLADALEGVVNGTEVDRSSFRQPAGYKMPLTGEGTCILRSEEEVGPVPKPFAMSPWDSYHSSRRWGNESRRLVWVAAIPGGPCGRIEDLGRIAVPLVTGLNHGKSGPAYPRGRTATPD
jgi:hypothetical protein